MRRGAIHWRMSIVAAVVVTVVPVLVVVLAKLVEMAQVVMVKGRKPSASEREGATRHLHLPHLRPLSTDVPRVMVWCGRMGVC